ncbi:pentapeptide repeat-containing protein [Streptomyces sp. NPDC127190]|uniref:pentapeptide repeat-containing protein n=1 Tax=unclassified Streptomyces TaxID=2593676 RepID=UPI003630CF9F
MGLAGALLASAGAFAGAWRSSRALRQNTERTLEHERTRLLNERFSTAAELLGHNEAACRLAGVHAMAGLADDWTERRQTCIDVLCAYLRMPYPRGLAENTPDDEDPNGQANREVRLTVIRTIRDHLLPANPAETSWSGYDLDFTGAVFDGGDFSNARFSGGKVRFTGATFSGGLVSFYGATFSGGSVGFYGATFSGSEVLFRGATFSGGSVNFRGATFSSDVVNFDRAAFSGGEVSFYGATFSSGTVNFDRAKFSSGTVNFDRARFSGATVTSHAAQFDGGVVDMRDVATWSRPPSLDDGLLTAPPAGLLLPGAPPMPKP